MRIRLIALCLWISGLAASAEEETLPSQIVIPDFGDLVEEDMPEDSSISLERRTAVAQRIAKAFAEAESVGIVSLEPSSRWILELRHPAMIRHLRKQLFAGYSYYGSVALDAELTATVSTAVVDAIDTPLTPRLGFCWAPRHAIVIRKAPEKDVILQLCYECGGMRIKDGEETLTFFPPTGIRKAMDDLFDRHNIPRSMPISLKERDEVVRGKD